MLIKKKMMLNLLKVALFDGESSILTNPHIFFTNWSNTNRESLSNGAPNEQYKAEMKIASISSVNGTDELVTDCDSVVLLASTNEPSDNLSLTSEVFNNKIASSMKHN